MRLRRSGRNEHRHRGVCLKDDYVTAIVQPEVDSGIVEAQTRCNVAERVHRRRPKSCTHVLQEHRFLCAFIFIHLCAEVVHVPRVRDREMGGKNVSLDDHRAVLPKTPVATRVDELQRKYIVARKRIRGLCGNVKPSFAKFASPATIARRRKRRMRGTITFGMPAKRCAAETRPVPRIACGELRIGADVWLRTHSATSRAAAHAQRICAAAILRFPRMHSLVSRLDVLQRLLYVAAAGEQFRIVQMRTDEMRL